MLITFSNGKTETDNETKKQTNENDSQINYIIITSLPARFARSPAN
ncbi:hypothetical protein SynMVIR181_00632 [Synechococcus sp. MVIR-18-1]|nr:hypothetical protein SynMVIR181_00632 [Synechococcus sp. MVIR-18-1]